MKPSPEQVLDTCLAQLKRGEDLEVVLAANPEHADELRPMLAAAALMRMEVPPPVRKATRKQTFLASVAARRREVEAADGYVTELKAGVPFDELVDRATPEMQPVVVAAWRMYTTAPPEPARAKVEAGRQRLMALAAERRAERRAAQPGVAHDLRAAAVQLAHGLRARPSLARRAWSGAVAALLTMMIVVAGMAGVGSAAASSLPGDAFYGVKELGREAQVLFAFDPQRRAELGIRFSEDRWDEMRALAADGRTVPVELVEAWLAGQIEVLQSLRSLPHDQRQLLAEMLLSTTIAPEAWTDELQGALGDPAVMDDLLRQSSDVLDEAKASAGVAEGPEPLEADRSAVPGQASSELPPEKAMSRRPMPEPKREPPAAQPEVVSPTVADERAPEPAPADVPDDNYVQPVVQDDRADHGDDDDASEPAGATVPEPADESPAQETAPPAFNQPVFEDPTVTPEPENPEDVPPEAPGSAPEGPGEPPPDEPPAEDPPGTEPAPEPQPES